ncbi:MAG TPA: hypothetical protein VGO80_11000 [Solirubrobacteraceae bacterium]|jgi:hypothetical protein|nr:hypothetical protein [Solirubrobacteraceae bacterium]
MRTTPEPSCDTCGARAGGWCRLSVGDCPFGASPPPDPDAARARDDRLVITHHGGLVRAEMLLGPGGETGRCDRDVDAVHAGGLLALLDAGWDLDRAGRHVTGLDVDRALAHVGAFPDRPVLSGGRRVRV